MALKILGKDGFYGWVNVAVMFFFNAAVMLMMMAFTLFLPFWVEEFSWSRAEISIAQTIAIILAGVGAPMVGIFIMKQGARRAMVIGNSMCVAALALLAYQTKIWHLYLLSGVLLGIGMSIGGMLAGMTVINNWFIKRRSIALALSMASMGLGGPVFSPLLMALIGSIGWRTTYLLIAAIVFVLCVLAPGLLIKNKPEDLGQVPDGPISSKEENVKAGGAPQKKIYMTPVDFTAKEALKTPTLWLLVIYGTLMFFAMNGLITHQFAFLLDIGLSRNTASMATGTMPAVMTISSLAIGILGLRFNMHYLAIGSMGIAIAGYITILFAHSLPVVLAYCIILGIGFGIQSIAMGNLFPNFFGVSEFPKIMGYTMPFNTIISSFGAPVAGLIRDRTNSYIPAFQLSIALLVMAFICILFAKPPLHPSLKKKQEQAVGSL
jgi:MFS family permease